MTDELLRPQDPLTAKVEALRAHKDRNWAVLNYKNIVRDLIQLTQAGTVLEIGGGRKPMFGEEAISQLGVRYTTSDILASELERAPDWVDKFVFDITTEDQSVLEAHRGRYDFAFSKWVMEHVRDYRRAYANIHSVLADGGMHIAWHPVLFSPPFVFNRLIPESLSRVLLRSVFPHRNDEETPKFPAIYSGCRISPRIRETIRAVGFRDVWQLPLYGHGYYSRIPALRDLHASASRALSKVDSTLLASYAFTIVRK